MCLRACGLGIWADSGVVAWVLLQGAGSADLELHVDIASPGVGIREFGEVAKVFYATEVGRGISEQRAGGSNSGQVLGMLLGVVFSPSLSIRWSK